MRPLLLVPVLLIAVLSLPVAGQPRRTSADQLTAVQAETLRLIAGLEGRPCPQPGTRDYVAGARDDAALSVAAEAEYAGLTDIMATMRRVAGDPAVSTEGRTRLLTLGGWQIVAASSRLSLLRLAQQARAETALDDGAAHPITLLLDHRRLLDQLSAPGLDGAALAALARVRSRIDVCRQEIGAAIIAANEPAIGSALAAARSSAEARAIADRHRLLADGAGLPVTTRYQQRLNALMEAEAARMRTATRSTPPAAAAIPSLPSAWLAAARRFVTASNQGNEAAALAELADEIELRTPEGVFRGKAQVREAVRRQSARGLSGRMGEPQSDGRRIFANGRVGAFNVTSIFDFNDAAKISRIVVQ